MSENTTLEDFTNDETIPNGHEVGSAEIMMMISVTTVYQCFQIVAREVAESYCIRKIRVPPDPHSSLAADSDVLTLDTTPNDKLKRGSVPVNQRRLASLNLGEHGIHDDVQIRDFNPPAWSTGLISPPIENLETRSVIASTRGTPFCIESYQRNLDNCFQMKEFLNGAAVATVNSTIPGKAKGFDQRIVTEFQRVTLICSVNPEPHEHLLEVCKRLSHLQESLRRCATTMKEYGGMLMVRDTHVGTPHTASTSELRIHTGDDPSKRFTTTGTHVDIGSLSPEVQAKNDDTFANRGRPDSAGGKQVLLCSTISTDKWDQAERPDMSLNDRALDSGEPGDSNNAGNFASSPEWKIPEKGGIHAPRTSPIQAPRTSPRF